MSLNTWPQFEKPREKLVNHGAETLSNAELLAILLGKGCAKKDAVALARELLQSYDGLHGVMQASFHSLRQHTGIGPAKYAQIQAAHELHRRYFQEPLLHGSSLADSDAVKSYLIAELAGLTHEVFSCLFLDTHLKLIRFEKLFRGTINAAVVHPRVVVKRALELNAAAVIIAHNHPSGEVQPSQQDHNLTNHLLEALALVEIQLIDHIIVGGHTTLSFTEEGYL